MNLVMRRDKSTIDRVVARNIVRLQRGLSAEDLAAHSGISLQRLKQILRAEISPLVGELERLANALHVTESQLLDRKSKRSGGTPVPARPTPRKVSRTYRRGRKTQGGNP